MSVSLNERLLAIPLYELNFITPFPKEKVFYEQTINSLNEKSFNKKTLLVIQNNNDWENLNKKSVVSLLIQEANLKAIIICYNTNDPLQDSIISLLASCQIPVIQINNQRFLSLFNVQSSPQYTYNNLSVELDGFFKRGFMDIAFNLSTAFATPFIFLDENRQLLWQTGPIDKIRKCVQWLEHHNNGTIDDGLDPDQYATPYIQFTINIANRISLFLITDADLSSWQRQIIDKFVGFTSVLFQTEEVIRDQNDRFKEYFIYELIYRKFESKQVLINQGKAWGYNLEKPHQLIIIEATRPEKYSNITDFLDEIVFKLETAKVELNEIINSFSFHDHVIILMEDDKQRTMAERREVGFKTAQWIKGQVKSLFPDSEINIGIGKWYFDTIDLNKSYQEAKIAIQFGKLWFTDEKIFHIHDLGVLHLLINIHRDLLEDFYEQYLSPLIISDQKEKTEYLLTLKTYFQYHNVIIDTAEALFIHPNTLRKRLKKIEELVGANIQNTEDLLTLMVAVKIYYTFSN